VESVFYVEGARLAGSVKRGLGRSEILAGVEIDRLTPGIDPDGYHDGHIAIARCHCFMLITTASPPRLSISPSRLAFRRMMTPCSFCNHRSPALVVPRAKP